MPRLWIQLAPHRGSCLFVFQRVLAALALSLAATSATQATPIVPNSTGLVGLPGLNGPIRLLDFDTPPPGVVNNDPLLAYDDFDVSFRNMYYGDVDYSPFYPPGNLPFPNHVGPYANNYYCSGNCGAPILERTFTIIPDFAIQFDRPVSAVAFSYITNPDDTPFLTGASTIKAYNGLLEVGSITAFDTTSNKFAFNNYYGFVGVTLDRLEFVVYSGDLSGNIDNLQFVVAIPEPTTCLLLTLGLVGLAARRRFLRSGQPSPR